MAKNSVPTDQERKHQKSVTKDHRMTGQPPKRYEELTFADDFMFGKVMEDKDLCREVLECLLREPVGELTDMQIQREFRYTKDGKPIRLDVCAGSEDIVYDAEMQNLNRKKPEDLELARRSRFYQSMMDADFLQKGQSYRRLPDGKVLFICTFDPFHKDLPAYSFHHHCMEDPKIILTDGTEKLFFNCSCKSKDMPEDLRNLYDYITDGIVSDELTRKIDEAVQRGRRNEEWRSEYMKELLHDDDVREEALAEGRELGRAEGIEIGRADGIEIGRANGIEIGHSQGLADGIEIGHSQGLADGIRLFIQDRREDGIPEDVILSKLMKLYSLTKEAAEQHLRDFSK